MRPEEHTILLREIDALAYDLVVSSVFKSINYNPLWIWYPTAVQQIFSPRRAINMFQITRAVNLSAVVDVKTGKEKQTEEEMMFSHLSEKFTKS